MKYDWPSMYSTPVNRRPGGGRRCSWRTWTAMLWGCDLHQEWTSCTSSSRALWNPSPPEPLLVTKKYDLWLCLGFFFWITPISTPPHELHQITPEWILKFSLLHFLSIWQTLRFLLSLYFVKSNQIKSYSFHNIDRKQRRNVVHTVCERNLIKMVFC